MREELLGYLMDALEPHQRASVEDRLRHDAQLQRELELLHESLEPLRADDAVFTPPTGLARRTCAFVARKSKAAAGTASPTPVSVAMTESGARRSSWSFADMAVAAGIFLAATTLLFPAIQHSRDTARIAGCQNNLRQLGTSLAQYSNMKGGYFPSIPASGPHSAAGMFAIQLAENELLPNDELLVCPNTELAKGAAASTPFEVPARSLLESSTGSQLVALLKKLGGSYGYSLGYVSNGEYRSIRNRGRSTFALMADAPSPDFEGKRSRNHSGCGQNVLYEDGHVVYMTDCVQGDLLDHVFLNDEWMMAAGTHADDSTIGHSYASPRPRLLATEAH